MVDFQLSRPRRTVAVVGRHASQPLLDRALDGLDYDVVVLELPERAYSCIRRTAPDLIIACVGLDTGDGCDVLTMLALDRETADIPVLTVMVEPEAGDGDEQAWSGEGEAPRPRQALSLN